MAENLFQESFNIDDTNIIKGLDDVEKALLSIQKQADSLATEFTDTFSGANDSAKALGATLGATAEQAAQANAKQAASIETVTRANQKWHESIRQTIGGIQVGGRSLSEWGNQAKDFAAQINLAGKAQGALTGGARVLGVALKATGIGLLIGLVASVVAYFTRFQGGIDKVTQATSALGAVVNVIIDRFLLLASAIGKVFSGDFSGAAADIAASVTGIGTAITNAASAAISLEKRFQALRDATITQSVEAARARVELEKFKKIMDDNTLSISARIKATQAAAAIEKRLADQAVERALEAQQIEQGKFDLSTKNATDRQKVADAEIALQETIVEANSQTFESETKLRELRKEAHERRLKQLEEESKALEKIAKDLEALRVAVLPDGVEKDLKAVEKRFNELQRITEDGINKLNEIESRRGLSSEEQAQLNELGAIRAKLEERRQSAFLDVLTSYAEKEIEIEEQLQNGKKALVDKDIAAQRASAKAVFDLKNQQIDITEEQFRGFIAALEANSVDESLIEEKKLDFDRIINEKRLQERLEFQLAMLAIAENEPGNRFESDEDRAQRLQSIKNSIALIKAELDTLSVSTQDGGKRADIWSLFGVDDEDGKQRFKDSLSIIKDGLSEIADARVREAEIATQAARDKVDAAQAALDEEKALQEQGLANNVGLKELELNLAKEAQEKALKEETKARKAQFLLDSATQLSSLITASANIVKGWSTIPIVGQVLAVASIAAMFAGFAAAKAQAAKAINAPKLRKGEKVQGRSHEQGGELRELEHNEQVVGVSESIGQDVFFNKMRRGEYRGLDLAAIADQHTRTGHKQDRADPLGESAPRIRKIEQRRIAAEDRLQLANLSKIYELTAERIVSAINEKPVVYPWKGGYKEAVKTKTGKTTKTVLPSE